MMRTFDGSWLKQSVAAAMWRAARQAGFYTGLTTPSNTRLVQRCTGYHAPSGSLLIFTLDVGHHSSGWWKNPDYERCWHLSISFMDPLTAAPTAHKDVELTEEWLVAFYGDDRRYVWAEPPYSNHGKAREVWHYRVFCDPAWQPIIPRGEVYSKEFTEAGWLSYSDLQNEYAKTLEPMAGEQ